MICTFLISQITSLTLKGQTSQHTIQLHKLVHYKSTLIKFLHNPSKHSFTGTVIIMRRALHHPDLQKLTQLLITIWTVTSHMKSVLITHRRAVAILPTWQCTTLCITLAADFYPIVNIIIRTANKGAGVNTCPLGRQLCIKKKIFLTVLHPLQKYTIFATIDSTTGFDNVCWKVLFQNQNDAFWILSKQFPLIFHDKGFLKFYLWYEKIIKLKLCEHFSFQISYTLINKS